MSRLAFFLCGWLLACALPAAFGAQCDNPRPLRFAQVPQNTPELQRQQYQSLYARLEQVLGRKVEVVQASSYNAVIEGLLDGSIDLAELGPASYVTARRRGAEIVPFASFSGQRGVWFDLTEGYQSALITRADSPRDSLEKLRGASVALIDPASTSGALYPRHAVAKLTGQPLERHFRRITFAGSHDLAIEAVRSGQVDAAFVSTTYLERAVQRGTLRRDELKVVWRSEVIPLDPFVYRKRLCAPLSQRIRQAMLDDQAALKPLFEQLQRPGFMPVSDARYQGIRALYDTVNP